MDREALSLAERELLQNGNDTWEQDGFGWHLYDRQGVEVQDWQQERRQVARAAQEAKANHDRMVEQ